jgi:CBS domain-containing protein
MVLLKYMKIKDIFIPSEVKTCSPETSWSEAATLLIEKQLPVVPVVDAFGKVVGVLSEKDLFHVLFLLTKIGWRRRTLFMI